MKVILAIVLALSALCAVSGRRLGETSSLNERDLMTDGDILSMLSSMGVDLDSLDFPALYERCCGEDTSACKCPVRNNEQYAEKWTTQCDTTLAYKAGVKEEPAATEAATDYASISTEKDYSMGEKGIFSMLEKMGVDLASLNYTDIYDRCCGADTEECKCPVRNNETYVEKWNASCNTTLAYKAGVTEAPEGWSMMSEYKDKMMDKASGMMSDGDFLAQFGMTEDTFDMVKLYETMFKKPFDYVAIADRCCSNNNLESPSKYMMDSSACGCPVRQQYQEKWDEQCEEVIVPGAEGMM